jgi:hypothetical protein
MHYYHSGSDNIDGAISMLYVPTEPLYRAGGVGGLRVARLNQA